MSSAQGVGAIAGGIGVTVLAVRLRRTRLTAVIMGWLSLALMAYANAPSQGAVIVCAALLGAGTSAFFVTVSTIIQRDAPSDSRGRIMAMHQASMGVSYGIGLISMGLVGDLVNLRVAFAVGSVGFAVGFLVIRRLSNSWYPAIDGEDVEVDGRLVAA
jgi:MFS family permease